MIGANRTGLLAKKRNVDDPYFDNVVLLLPFTGIDNRTVFPDCSNNVINAYAVSDLKITTAKTKWGNGSGNFSNNYITITDDTTDLLAGDFTLEAWVYNSLNNGISSILCFGDYFNNLSTSLIFYIYDQTKIGLLGGSLNILGGTVPGNEWSHVAAVRSGTSVAVYINGQHVDTQTSSDSFSGTLLIGARNYNNTIIADLASYLQDLRITKGISRYNSNFTIPSKAFYYPTDVYFSNVDLLLPFEGDIDFTSIVDYSWNQKSISLLGDTSLSFSESKWGNGSCYFDGDGDYITIDNYSLALSNNDFTIELWAMATNWPTSNAGAYGSFLVADDEYLSRGFLFGLTGTANSFTDLAFYGFVDNSYYLAVSVNTEILLDTWYHFAVSRKNNMLYLFKNGNLLNAGGDSFNITIKSSTSNLKVGANKYNATYNYYFNGYIQDVRITTTVGRYTSSFTPPQYKLRRS